MTTRLTFTTASVSAPGGRAYNEDACGHRDGCWVLADGLGGHGGGEIAARVVVDAMLAALTEAPPTPAALTAAIDAADAALHARQQGDTRLAGMRTTLVVLLSDGAVACWAHVGDSRLYHLRDGRIIAQTEDHSVPQAMVKAGELRPAEIRYHEDRNRLLRSLGGGDPPRPTLGPTPGPKQAAEPVPLAVGDAFLLCSDGFWEAVTETELELTRAKAPDPDTWLRLLLTRVADRAGPEHDNYSAIAIYVGPEAP